MGWRYRKTARFGPLRVNLSKSGIGYSIGGKGFRTGVRATGRTYTTVSLPGTGLSYTTGAKQSRQATGCLVVLAAPAAVAAAYLLLL